MKKIFFFCITVLISLAAQCQDVIIKKSGEEIKAKILEVGVSEIKYKRFDFQDGPVYSISKGEVVLVRYENGVNEVISSTPTSTTTTPTTTTTAPTPSAPEVINETIENSMGTYRQNGRYISKARVISVLKSTNDPEILKLLRRSNGCKTTGTVVALGLGLPLIIVGTITTLRGAIITSNNSSMNMDPDGKGITTVGIGMIGTGLTLQFINIGMQVKGNNLVDDAVAIYNSKYANKAQAK